MKYTASALLLTIATAALAAPTLLHARAFDAHLAARRAHAPGARAPPDLFYDQTLDHFDVLRGGATWRQRYWLNASLVRGADFPVFFYIEGEGAGSPFSVVSGEHVELAAEYGALLVALEHRYYGASIPTPDLSTPNMRFLSSHQALADIAAFYENALRPAFNLTVRNKLVTFGGSYPGALSAWARLRLPHIVHAAVSTSSPVQASFDDVSYNDVVAASLAMPLIGGSPGCAAATAAAFRAMDAAFSGGADARRAMASKLMSCGPLDGANDTMWAASNYGSFVQGLVQYNLEGGYSVAQYCAEMTRPGAAPIDAFAAAIAATQGGACLDNSYADYVAQLRNTTVDLGARGLGLRAWTWQCCTQFSFWQDCDANSSCPLSRAFMTLDSNTQQCQDAFGGGVSRALNERTTRFTNAYMGGSGIASSRIIFVNGNVDPWHALSLFNSSSAAQPSVFINGSVFRAALRARARKERGASS